MGYRRAGKNKPSKSERHFIRVNAKIQDLRENGILKENRPEHNGKNTLTGMNQQENSVMYVKDKGILRKSKPVGMKIHTKNQFYTAFRVLNNHKQIQEPYNYM